MTNERTFRERATRGFAWNYLYKLTELGLMNLYTIVVVRHFGPEISAPYAVFTALCTTISIICAFAVDGLLLRYIQRISVNEHSHGGNFTDIESFGLHRFLKTLFAFRILVVTVVSLLIIIALFILPYILPILSQTFGSIREFSPYMFVFLYAQAVIAFCTFSLIGLLETKLVFWASLVSRGLLLITGLILVFEGSLSLHFAIGLFVASAVLNAGCLLYVFSGEVSRSSGKAVSKRFPFSSVMREMWNLITGVRHIKLFLATPIMLYGIITWGSDILSTVLGRQPDILMMRGLLGEHSSEIGYYLSASLLLLVTEYIFLFGLGGTLVSIFSKLAHDDEKEALIGRNRYPRLYSARKEIAGFQNVVLLPLCGYMMVFAPDVIRSIYGNKYDAAIPMLRIGLLALAISVGLFGGGLQITSLIAIGKQRLVFRNRVCWGIVNIIANFFLIRSYGGLGAIIGTQFANAFACGTESYFAYKIIGRSFNFLGTIRIIAISCISVLGGYYLIRIMSMDSLYLSNVMISALFTGLTIAILYAFFKIPEAKKVWQRMKGLFRQSNSKVFSSE